MRIAVSVHPIDVHVLLSHRAGGMRADHKRTFERCAPTDLKMSTCDQVSRGECYYQVWIPSERLGAGLSLDYTFIMWLPEKWPWHAWPVVVSQISLRAVTPSRKEKKKNFFNGFLFFVSSYFETEMLLILVPSSLSHTRAHTHTHAPHTHTSSEPLMTGSSWAISSATGQSVRGRTESWQRRTTRHSQIPERHAAKMKRWRGQTGRESRQRGSKSGGGVCGTGDF